MKLTPIDVVIIATYMAVIVLIAARSRIFAGKNLENFFLAGRNLPGWMTGVSYAASMVSADSAVGCGGLAVVAGVYVCWIYLSRFGIALFLGSVLFAVYWRRLSTFTTLEFYEIRFEGTPGTLMRFWLAFRTSLIAMVAWTGISLLALVKISQPVLGWGTTATLDLLAGPTEILVIADDTADPALVACDLLGQAEHDPNSGVCLICLSKGFARRTLREIDAQLQRLPTRGIAELSWRDQGIVYVAEGRAEAVQISDSYAPEHLELQVQDPAYFLERLTNYGSLFIGEETTVAYGDKTIGTNHILPTSRAARYTGGVWVSKFLKTCTYQRMTREASVRAARVTERQCILENMHGHAATARMRIERYVPALKSPRRFSA